MKCPSCQIENAEGAKFCNECGYRLALPCPQCNRLNPASHKFCSQCGSPLETLAETPIPTTEAERKQVTVLFSDLSG
ncbi:MAG: zinc ribbon domain-containing protein, partial [candidate division NC10 bacterium]|nr:zinc ribbon domain-containing protein [candidate division NC10 bacterium]